MDENVENVVFIAGGVIFIFLMLGVVMPWLFKYSSVDQCEYKGELTNFADATLIELDNEVWINVRLDKTYHGWEDRVYNDEPVYKCVGRINIGTTHEIWRIGD